MTNRCSIHLVIALAGQLLLSGTHCFGQHDEKPRFEFLKPDYTLQELYFRPTHPTDSTFTGIDTVHSIAIHLEDSIQKDSSIIYGGRTIREHVILLVEYDNGKKTRVTGYYDNGQKYDETNFWKGVRHGLSTSWYINGKIKSQRYWENGKPATPIIDWHEDGSLRRIETLDEEDRAGFIKEWDRNGNIAREFFVVDTMEKNWENVPEYFERDTTTGCGVEKFYHNGKLTFVEIVSCGRQPAVFYHNNGRVSLRGDIITAIWSRVGKWTEWYEDGTIKCEAYFSDTMPNVKEGAWKYWDEKGNLVKTEYYSNDELLRTDYPDTIRMKKKKTDG